MCSQRIVPFLVCLSLFAGGGRPLSAEEVYLDADAFIEQSFNKAPETKVIWLTKELKAGMEEILGHAYKGLRIRYWRSGDRTAWILEEIGKTEPITAGFVVEDNVLQSMEVLIYRESHGWEVRYPFFRNQFKGAGLSEESELDKQIDGISGATLSVNALIRLSRLALFLHQKALQ